MLARFSLLIRRTITPGFPLPDPNVPLIRISKKVRQFNYPGIVEVFRRASQVEDDFASDAKASEARLLGERCVPTWRCEISSNRHFDDWSGGFEA